MKYPLFAIITSLSLITLSNGYAEDHHVEEGNAHSPSLIEIMQGMDKSLQELSSGIMNNDFELITSSAHSIANHPHIGAEDIETLFARLGDKKEGFITCDKAVHQLAVDIAMAGKEENMDKVLERHSAMVSKATECHKEYK